MPCWTGFERICRADVALDEYNWYRLGGSADWFLTPRDPDETRAVLQRSAAEGVPWRILGGGANLLVRDEGVRGAILRLESDTLSFIRPAESTIDVGAGADLTRLTKLAAASGWGGLECLAGIPGTIGGAIRMNAGGRWGCIGDLVVSVDLLDAAGARRSLSAAEAGFSYRRCAIEGGVILGATLRFTPAAPHETWARYKDIWNTKYSTQPPVSERSAGCIFKNPPGESAGRLIDRAGLKGERRGGARISDRHANFIVAEGDARAADVLALIDVARERVRREFGVELELEIEIW